MATYKEQIEELLDFNGWTGKFTLTENGNQIEVRLSVQHHSAPGEIVNVYTEGMHPLEQIQQECLRSLRTGRPGV